MSLSSSTGLSRLLGRGLWTRARRLRERRPRRARFRLAVDLLESRALLSTLTVTNTNDSGKGSLRDEVAQAKASDTIAFASGLQGNTITLTSGPITINKLKHRVLEPGDRQRRGKDRVFVVTPPPMRSRSSMA